jgi:hypothetical protein
MGVIGGRSDDSNRNSEFYSTFTRIVASSTSHFQNKSVMPSASEASPRLILNLMIKSLIIIDVYKG